MNQHTPTPWYRRNDAIRNDEKDVATLNYHSNNSVLWLPSQAESDANAELIVRAVNSHAALVETAGAMLNVLHYIKHCCAPHDEWFLGEFSTELEKTIKHAEAAGVQVIPLPWEQAVPNA